MSDSQTVTRFSAGSELAYHVVLHPRPGNLGVLHEHPKDSLQSQHLTQAASTDCSHTEELVTLL